MPRPGIRRFTLFSVCLLGVWAEGAMGPKPRERATVEVEPIARRLTAPVAPPVVTPGRGEGPRVSLEEFLTDRSRKRKKITEAQIAKMKSLLAITQDDDPQKPDFFFRIGELYAENQRFCFNQSHALDQKLFDAPASAKPALRTQQQGFEREEQAWLLEAVKAYVAATRFSRYERMDEVLFRLAALLTAAKKEDQAREFFHRLIKDHPTSKYIPDAYLAFAEHAFDQAEMESALRLYEKVEQFPRSSVTPYAVYKKGWCHINLGDYKQALETFVGVVRLTRDGKVPVPGSSLGVLAKEAKKDIVRAYAQVGGPDKAWPFFQRTGGEYAPKMMESLAELYWEEGKFGDSTRVYKKIIAENMSSARVCEWQGKVLRNSFSAGNKRDQMQELERLALVEQQLRAAKPSPKSNRSTVDECRDGLHDASRETALVWHREGQKTGDPDTFALAERAYRTFLGRFPDDKQAYEMSYYAGEVLWVLKRWKEAAEQYTRVVEMNPGGKYLRDAAYAAMLAWKNALLVDDDERAPRVEEERAQLRGRAQVGQLAPRPIPENKQKMIAAFHAYRRHVPDAPELPVILYQEGYICYDHNQFDCAEKAFGEVVDRFTTHKLAVFAANLRIDALNAQGKTREVISEVERFLGMSELMKDPEFGREMIALKSDSYDLEGREDERRHDYKECGRAMLASAEALPEHPKHAQRLWNAGQCFQNAHLVGQAVSAWETLMKNHPADPLAKKALYRVGAGFQQLAFYRMAADKYEEFAKRFPGEPQAVTALGNATVFREGLGESDAAIADMDAFVRFYGARNPQDAAGVYFQKGEVYDRQGKQDLLAAQLRSYLEKWGGRGGLDRQVQAHFRLGQLAWKRSCPHPSEDGACVEITRIASTRGRLVIDVAKRKLHRDKRTQCGPPTKSKIAVLDRDRQQASAAEDHLRTALRLWRAGDAANPIAGKDAEARRAMAAHAAAGASFILAEKDYEDLLRVKFPQNLDFSRPSPRDSPARQAAAGKKLADSSRRFAAYLADKARLLEKARAEYLEVFKLRQAHWTIAAAARIGQLHQDFAGQLYTAEIPRDLPETDRWGNQPRDLYCNELEDRAGKVEAQATEGFKSCLGAATRESWFNEWSRLCERELNQLEPLQFPVASEIKPEAAFVPTTLSAAPLVSTLNDEPAAPAAR